MRWKKGNEQWKNDSLITTVTKLIANSLGKFAQRRRNCSK